jgi:uncharacterized protein (TIGR02453 family)
MSRFAGIPLDAIAFYGELEANNTKDWWAANKERYERSVREPVLALTDALEEEFGEVKVFRPYRDVRFTTDKTPYKTEQGAIATAPDGTGYYLRVGSEGLTTGGGYMHAMPDQVARFRAAVDDGSIGAQLAGLVHGLRRTGFQVGGETLKTRPKGVREDHPRLDLLRHKSLIVWRERGTPAWLHTGSVVRYVRDDWRSIRPLVEWMRTHVGATTMPTPVSQRR